MYRSGCGAGYLVAKAGQAKAKGSLQNVQLLQLPTADLVGYPVDCGVAEAEWFAGEVATR